MRHYWTPQHDFLPKRFVFMGEEGPSESYSPDEGVGGVSEEAAERAAEERRQAAQAAKKQRKEEKKVKKRDTKLADIIRGFIQGSHRNDKMALLLSRLFQRNTPATVLLAVLSLAHPEVIEVLENYLDDEKEVMPDPDHASSAQQADANGTALVEYGKELAQSLSEWTRRIFTHASFRPMKSILALAHHHGVDHNMTQLTALIIQEYFRKSGQEMDFERTKQFSEFFWRDALKRLHQMASERGLLPETTTDPLGDDDEDDEDDDDDED